MEQQLELLILGDLDPYPPNPTRRASPPPNVRRAVKLAEDESRFENVTTLGVDEHIWHHVDSRKRGPKELTGMVDLSRDSTGKTRARLLVFSRGFG